MDYSQFLFCGVRETFKDKVQVCFLSLSKNSLYMLEFDDSEEGLRELQRAEERIKEHTHSLCSIFCLPVYTYFKSPAFKNFFLGEKHQALRFGNRLINHLYSLFDFEYEIEMKNQACALACLGCILYLVNNIMKLNPEIDKIKPPFLYLSE